jgi:Sec1 family.
MEKEELSLFESFRYRILTEIVHETRQNTPNFLLVVDKKSLSVVSGGVQVIDLTERGVTVIEMLEKPRMPLPEVDVLYFFIFYTQICDKTIERLLTIPFLSSCLPVFYKPCPRFTAKNNCRVPNSLIYKSFQRGQLQLSTFRVKFLFTRNSRNPKKLVFMQKLL